MPVKKRYPVPSDLEIAQEAELRPITEVAKDAGILDEEIELYGSYIAKIDYARILERLKDKPEGKLITVTAITPTPLGEGKTVTAFGLGQALYQMMHPKGIKVINTFREPSKGPTFGIKGGATGGGYSQALPMENINLHFTGDIHAVETAHNLCAAAIDASILHKNKLNLDPLNITWTYCQDLNSRALREVIVGLGGRKNGYPRVTNFDITVATETAAILALTTGLKNLRERLGRAVVGYTYDKKPVTCEDLKVAGAMTVLLKDAIKPNLVQSTEGHPMICHGFPFANVAHGNNSVMANMVALKLADYVVTESGFGADCGFVKLIDVACRQSGMKVDCAVIVASIRALKEHGGAYHLRPGMPYSAVKEAAETENLPAVEKGCENLARNIQIVKMYGIPAVVAINRFTTDTDREIELVKKKALEAGADGVAVSEAWAKGGEGALELAEKVIEAIKKPHEMKFLFPDDISIKEKIETIATKVYLADGVEYSSEANQKIKLYTDLGFSKMTINVAKTHLSLSHNPNWKGVPRGYKLPVRDIRASVGAGFFYPICGSMQTMPGLPSRPAFVDVDIDPETGKTKGLF
ncbi:MAG TPA: formate--tetrahydrofolate ligase [Candidatus Aerophobetes bacterium]|uniref:Formate--tetrahydrofolate ligase n=1 Tax=Aerophobetes bacterium TaxID=2030807 RepID=A0A7V0MZG8_UNCAE|nr:formate--tetrahydrofolate ligase [Candidatus Aerophobetes bacterium]